VKLASGAAALSCLAVVTSAPLVMALPAATAGVSPAVSASATTTAASLVGDLLTRQWSISPGSGAIGGATAGAVTTAFLDTATGVNHAAAASADFSLTANGMAMTSAAGWTSVTAVAGTAAADPGHSPGPLGLPAQTVTFTYALTTGPAQLIVTRQYRLAPGDAMTEVRTSLAAVGAPVVVSNWTVDELTMRPAPRTPFPYRRQSGERDRSGSVADRGGGRVVRVGHRGCRCGFHEGRRAAPRGLFRCPGRGSTRS